MGLYELLEGCTHAENRDLRSKSDLSAELIARLSEENAKLRDLICHAWVHAAYEKSGWGHMTTEQKELFDRVAKEEIAKGD